MTVIDTSRPPEGAIKKASFGPKLLLGENHHLCPGCGHPLATRVILEVMEELQLEGRSIAVYGHGCFATFVSTADVDLNLSLHGRAPATATGIKRMRPDKIVFTMQGDGDMVSEGLAEIMHTAARGEKLTCFLLNNGVFGDTGGQMTAASAMGQRSKTSQEGRDAAHHGYPVPIADVLTKLQGVSYVARSSVHNAAGIALTKKFVRRGFEHQLEGRGLALVEILTMCPTGWFMPTKDGPDYMMDTLGKAYPFGELKDTSKLAEPVAA